MAGVQKQEKSREDELLDFIYLEQKFVIRLQDLKVAKERELQAMRDLLKIAESLDYFRTKYGWHVQQMSDEDKKVLLRKFGEVKYKKRFG